MAATTATMSTHRKTTANRVDAGRSLKRAASGRPVRGRVGLDAPHAPLDVLEQLAVDAHQLGEQAEDDQLEADDEQHRGQQDRLDVPAALAERVVEQEPGAGEQAQP